MASFMPTHWLPQLPQLSVTPRPASQAPPVMPRGGTHDAIAEAARATDTDFGYLLAQAKLESNLDPKARARTSSASGLYQFIDQTWLRTLDRHGEALGFGREAAAIRTDGGRARIVDGDMRSHIMALRFDPRASALMAGALASDNRAALSDALGRDPQPSELYLAHFLGQNGATRFLETLSRAPDTKAAAILPAAARANRPIFYSGGAARSVSQVMALMEGKMARAMAGNSALPEGDMPMPAIAGVASEADGFERARGRFADERMTATTSAVFASRLPAPPAPPLLPETRAPRPSMASTLRDSFGSASGGAALPAHVARAYDRLQAFGL